MSPGRAAVRLALAAAVVYLSVPTIHLSGDTDPQLFTASAWIIQGDARLDPYPPTGLTGEIRTADGWYSVYPPGLALVSAPFLAPFLRAGVPVLDPTFRALFGRVFAAALVALSVAFVYLACRRIARPVPALIATLGYAFATSAWAVASQELWQHSASLLFVALGTFLTLRGPATASRAGLAFALAVLLRPFNVIALLFGWLTAARRGGVATFLRFGAWGLPGLAFLLTYNLIVAGSPLGLLVPGTVPWEPLSPSGLIGLLVSPSRGLFVFSPYLVLGIVGGWQAWRHGTGRRAQLARDGSVAVLAFWLAFASVGWWWGGWTYGNRYLLDALPIATLLVAYAIGHRALDGRARRFLAGLAFGWSALLQLAGALYGYREWNGYNWNASPPVDAHPERVWDWSDPQWWSVLRQIGTDPWVLLVPPLLGLAVAVVILRPVVTRVGPDRTSPARPGGA